MITIKFTVRIKPEHNPPKFNEELGEGVLNEVTFDFKNMTEDEFNSPQGQNAMLEIMKGLISDWIEVIPERL